MLLRQRRLVYRLPSGAAMAIDVEPAASPEPSRRLARVSRQIAADVSPPPSPGSPSLEQRARQAAEKAIAARSPPPRKPPPKRIPATETPVYADKNAGSVGSGELMKLQHRLDGKNGKKKPR